MRGAKIQVKTLYRNTHWMQDKANQLLVTFQIRITASKLTNLVTFLTGLSLRLIAKKFLIRKIIKPKTSAVDLLY